MLIIVLCCSSSYFFENCKVISDTSEVKRSVSLAGDTSVYFLTSARVKSLFIAFNKI